MNILFLTVGRFDSIEAHSIYADLLRCFRNHGHEVYTIASFEKKTRKKTTIVEERGAHTLHIETGNVTETKSLIKKGVAQMSIEPSYIKAIKKFFISVKFELVIYSTPPIFFAKVVEYVKKRDGAKSYLLLKDIFPQNAVDLEMMTKNGVKGLIYRYFRAKEKKLYSLSDYIGCMSEANVKYVIDHNPEIDAERVEVCPNTVEVVDKSIDANVINEIRKKYGIPFNKTVFVYGGNLGKPQGIVFLIECLKKCADIENVFFLIVGDGTEFHLLQEYINDEKPRNVCLMKRLPKEEYDTMIGACDVGMIFLDHRFTIPNFPSRLLAYMQAQIPVLAVTDPNTDIGEKIVNGGFGWWCESNNKDDFYEIVSKVPVDRLKEMGSKGYYYLINNYTVDNAYKKISSHISELQCER